MIRRVLAEWIERCVDRPLVGMEITDRRLRAAELDKSGDRYTLTQIMSEPLDPVAGKEKAYAAFLASGFSTRDVALGIASCEIAVNAFRFPKMPKKELVQSIQIEAEQIGLSGHKADDMVTDWYRYGGGIKGEQKGLLGVIPRSALDNHIREVRAGGLNPCVVDAKPLALWNGYWNLMPARAHAGDAVLLLHLEEFVTHLVVASDPRTLYLARTIPTGFGSGLSGASDDDSFLSEIVDSLTFIRHDSPDFAGIRECYVSGETCSKEHLTAIGAALGIPVRLWNPLEHLDMSPEVRDKVRAIYGPSLAVVVGLAMRKYT